MMFGLAPTLRLKTVRNWRWRINSHGFVVVKDVPSPLLNRWGNPAIPTKKIYSEAQIKKNTKKMEKNLSIPTNSFRKIK